MLKLETITMWLDRISISSELVFFFSFCASSSPPSSCPDLEIYLSLSEKTEETGGLAGGAITRCFFSFVAVLSPVTHETEVPQNWNVQIMSRGVRYDQTF